MIKPYRHNRPSKMRKIAQNTHDFGCVLRTFLKHVPLLEELSQKHAFLVPHIQTRVFILFRISVLESQRACRLIHSVLNHHTKYVVC